METKPIKLNWNTNNSWYDSLAIPPAGESIYDGAFTEEQLADYLGIGTRYVHTREQDAVHYLLQLLNDRMTLETFRKDILHCTK